MPFAAALSEHPLADPRRRRGGRPGARRRSATRPTWPCCSSPAPFAGAIEDIAATVRATLRPGALIGATASSVLGGDREVEERGRRLAVRHALRAGPAAPTARPGGAGRGGPHGDGWRVTADLDLALAGATLVLLADPFSFPADAFLDELTGRAPGLTVVGGLASAAGGPAATGSSPTAPSSTRRRGRRAARARPRPRAVVSQGCRPVGEPLVVTRAERQHRRGDRRSARRSTGCMAQADAASPEDRALLARSLHVGLVVDERKLDFGRGDFLIRSVLGADHDRRRRGRRRRGRGGHHRAVPGARRRHGRRGPPRACWPTSAARPRCVFTCNGRGTNLFDEPDHDAGVVHAQVDGGATAGMFCAGEIGPVGARHFVHTMTTTVLLLDDRP